MFTLYEHNQKAYDAALMMMNKTGKAAVIHPTGTGKSFIGIKLAEQHPDSRICWLSPSEYIYKTQIENLKIMDGYELENIIFMTYAKLMFASDEIIREIQPNYIVFDEFHRCGATEWSKGVERLLKFYPDVPILGLSATNVRYLDNQRDMADELFDGNVASEITLGEAIVRNILLPPVYIASVYSYQKDLEKYQHKVNKTKNPIVRGLAQKHLDALRRTLTKADGLDEIFNKHIKDMNGKFIIFCANIEHVEEVKERVPEWFGKVDNEPHIYTVYFDDSASKKEFHNFKKDNSDHLKLLLCVDMLNEGVHIEDISGVILLRPTVSPIIYKQQIGRALSASKRRVPMIFDIVNNFENLYSIGFIRDEMREAVRYYTEIGEAQSIINTRFSIIDEAKDCKRLFNELQDTLSASWEIMFNEARDYYDKHGHLIVPKRYRTTDGISLGSWIETQRRVKMEMMPGIMNKEREEKLDSIGMVWGRVSDYNFEINYSYAKEYYEKHGNLNVVIDYVTPDGFALGRWLSNLRYSIKKNNSEASGRVKRLNDIGMIWDKNDYIWGIYYDAALDYYKEHGNLDIVGGYKTKDSINLGAWIKNLRVKYEKGKLSKSQIDDLNNIDMTWESPFDKNWQICYERAAEYYHSHGNLDIPNAYKTSDGIPLGKWIRRHRINEKTGKSDIKITKKRKEMLDKIGMVWSIDGSWETRYELLVKYFEHHGDIEIPRNYVTGEKIWLGKWLYIQKRIYMGKEKGNALTSEQIYKLEALGINWNIDYKERLFEEYLKEFEIFHREHGNLNIPLGYVGRNGKRLDLSANLLRKKYKVGKLSDGQILKLEELGFDFGEPQSEEKPRNITYIDRHNEKEYYTDRNVVEM